MNIDERLRALDELMGAAPERRGTEQMIQDLTDELLRVKELLRIEYVLNHAESTPWRCTKHDCHLLGEKPDPWCHCVVAQETQHRLEVRRVLEGG